MLVIKRIHVRYHLQAEDKYADVIQRSFELHPPKCPVYQSLSGSIDITTELAEITAT